MKSSRPSSPSDASWLPPLLDLEREACRRSLAEFTRQAWHVLEPGRPLLWGRVMDAICQHLEAVSAGIINRLLINVPPGTAKSLIASVFWPMWEWGPGGQPENRVLSFSYSDRLSIRDNRRCRILVDSPWFQERWPLKIVSDQNQKTLFENDARGWRMASSVGGVATGSRADRILLDDPHHVADGESPAKLESARLFFNEVLPTRLNDPERTPIVVIMQRVHSADVAGEIIARDLGYEHLMLPMLYEPDRHCRTSIGFEDWRTQDGELLFPDRFPAEVVERDRKVMGSYAFSAQMQQSPSPRGGGMLKVERMTITDDWPRHAKRVRAWDFAGTEKRHGNDPDYTAGVLMAELDGRFWIVHVEHGRWEAAGVEGIVRQTAELDRLETAVLLKQEPGSSGKAVSDHFLRRVLLGFAATALPDSGSKTLRVQPMAASVEAGNVMLVRGEWNQTFIGEARTFPAGAHDDMVDAAASAFLELTRPAKGVFFAA